MSSVKNVFILPIFVIFSILIGFFSLNAGKNLVIDEIKNYLMQKSEKKSDEYVRSHTISALILADLRKKTDLEIDSWEDVVKALNLLHLNFVTGLEKKSVDISVLKNVLKKNDVVDVDDNKFNFMDVYTNIVFSFSKLNKFLVETGSNSLEDLKLVFSRTVQAKVALEKELEQNKQKLNASLNNYKKLEKDYNDLKTTSFNNFKNLEKDYTGLKAANKNLEKDYNDLKASYENLEKDYNDLKAANKNLEKDYNDLKASYGNCQAKSQEKSQEKPPKPPQEEKPAEKADQLEKNLLQKHFNSDFFKRLEKKFAKAPSTNTISSLELLTSTSLGNLDDDSLKFFSKITLISGKELKGNAEKIKFFVDFFRKELYFDSVSVDDLKKTAILFKSLKNSKINTNIKDVAENYKNYMIEINNETKKYFSTVFSKVNTTQNTFFSKLRHVSENHKIIMFTNDEFKQLEKSLFLPAPPGMELSLKLSAFKKAMEAAVEFSHDFDNKFAESKIGEFLDSQDFVKESADPAVPDFSAKNKANASRLIKYTLDSKSKIKTSILFSLDQTNQINRICASLGVKEGEQGVINRILPPQVFVDGLVCFTKLFNFFTVNKNHKFFVQLINNGLSAYLEREYRFFIDEISRESFITSVFDGLQRWIAEINRMEGERDVLNTSLNSTTNLLNKEVDKFSNLKREVDIMNSNSFFEKVKKVNLFGQKEHKNYLVNNAEYKSEALISAIRKLKDLKVTNYEKLTLSDSFSVEEMMAVHVLLHKKTLPAIEFERFDVLELPAALEHSEGGDHVGRLFISLIYEMLLELELKFD